MGQEIVFNVLALPGHSLTANINYVSAAIDPATRRLMVRATVDNKDGQLKPVAVSFGHVSNPYPREYASFEPDLTTMEKAAIATGGVVDPPTVAAVFDAARDADASTLRWNDFVVGEDDRVPRQFALDRRNLAAQHANHLRLEVAQVRRALEKRCTVHVKE